MRCPFLEEFSARKYFVPLTQVILPSDAGAVFNCDLSDTQHCPRTYMDIVLCLFTRADLFSVVINAFAKS